MNWIFLNFIIERTIWKQEATEKDGGDGEINPQHGRQIWVRSPFSKFAQNQNFQEW